MTLNELLKAKGIDEKLIGEIMAEMKENKIFTAAEENLDIRYGKLKTDHEGVNKQLTEANALIEEMKKATKVKSSMKSALTSSFRSRTSSTATTIESMIGQEITRSTTSRQTANSAPCRTTPRMSMPGSSPRKTSRRSVESERQHRLISSSDSAQTGKVAEKKAAGERS